MEWYVLLSISIVAGVSASLLHRTILKGAEHHTSGFAIASGLFSSLWIGIILLFVGFDTRFELLSWWNVFFMAVLWSASDVLMNKAIHITEAAVFNVMFATRAFWSIATALVFLNESLELVDWLGTLLLFGGVVITVYEPGAMWRNKAIGLSLLTSFIVGIAITNDGVALQNDFQVPSYYLFAFLFPVIIISTFSKAGRQSAKKLLFSSQRNSLALLGGLHALSGLTLYYAFQADQSLSVLVSINQVQTILVAIGAIFLLRERKNIPRRLFATFVAFLGIILITAV